MSSITGSTEAGNVCVAVRVRPLIPREIQSGSQSCWLTDKNSLEQVDPETNKSSNSLPHAFDHVFSSKQKTKEIYDQVVGPIINEAFSGFNGTILCYGQTSSGKTFTLYGNDEEEGIISLAARDLFERISSDNLNSYGIRIGLLEIYNERMSDLLSGSEVTISEANGIVVPKNLTEIEVRSPQEILENVKKVQGQRKIGETRMNKESSRSHTILRIQIEIMPVQGIDSGDEIQVTNALLNFVDLAGSEKAGQTGAIGERFREATYINKSLSVLSQVVMQLTSTSSNGNPGDSLGSNTSSSNLSHLVASASGKRQQLQPRYINFRDSKLTHILKSSLSGNAFNAIICNVTPASISLEETLSTLRFAKTAKTIKTSPKPNRKMLNNEESKQKIRELQVDLDKKRSEVDYLTKQLGVYQKFSCFGTGTPPRVENVGLTASGLSERRKTWCPDFRARFMPQTIIEDIAEKEIKPKEKNIKRRQTTATERFISSDDALVHFSALELEQHKNLKLFPGRKEIELEPAKDAQVQTDYEPPRPKKSRFDDDDDLTTITDPSQCSTPPSTLRRIRNDLSIALVNDIQDIQTLKTFHFEELQLEKNQVKELEARVQTLEFENNQLNLMNQELLAAKKELQNLREKDWSRSQEIERLEKANKSLQNEINELRCTTDISEESTSVINNEQLIDEAQQDLEDVKKTLLYLKLQIPEVVKTKDSSTLCEILTYSNVTTTKEVLEKSVQISASETVSTADCSTLCEILTVISPKKVVEMSVQAENVQTTDSSTLCEILTVISPKKVVEMSVQAENVQTTDSSTLCEILTVIPPKKVVEMAVQVDEIHTTDSSTLCEILTFVTPKKAVEKSIQVENVQTTDSSTLCEILTFISPKKVMEKSTQIENVQTTDTSALCEILTCISPKEVLGKSVQVGVDKAFETVKTTDSSTSCEILTFVSPKKVLEKSTQVEDVQTTHTASICEILTVVSPKKAVEKSMQVEEIQTTDTSTLCEIMTFVSPKKVVEKSMQVDEVQTTETSTLCEILTFIAPKIVVEKSVQVDDLDKAPETVKTADCSTLCEILTFISPKEVLEKSVQVEDVKKVPKLHRAVQTEAGLDLAVQIRDLKIEVKTLKQKALKERESRTLLIKDHETSLSQLKNIIGQKTQEISELNETIDVLKKEHEESLVSKCTVSTEVQCDYMTELIKMSRSGELELLPNEFPDITELLKLYKDNKLLTHQIYILQTKITKYEQKLSEQQTGFELIENWAKPQQKPLRTTEKIKLPNQLLEHNRKTQSVVRVKAISKPNLNKSEDRNIESTDPKVENLNSINSSQNFHTSNSIIQNESTTANENLPNVNVLKKPDVSEKSSILFNSIPIPPKSPTPTSNRLKESQTQFQPTEPVEDFEDEIERLLGMK